MASLEVEMSELSSPRSRSHVAMATVMARILSGTGRGGEGGEMGVAKRAVGEVDNVTSSQIKRRKLQTRVPESDSHSRFQHVTRDELSSSGDEASSLRHSGPADIVGKCHQLPGDTNAQDERDLQSMATRGVVQLFNAVSKQQKIIEKKTKEAGSSERKRSKVLKSIDKGSFIDMLKSGGSEIPSRKSVKKQSHDPSWSTLHDDYLKSRSATEDWEEEEEKGEDLSDSDSDS